MTTQVWEHNKGSQQCHGKNAWLNKNGLMRDRLKFVKLYICIT